MLVLLFTFIAATIWKKADVLETRGGGRCGRIYFEMLYLHLVCTAEKLTDALMSIGFAMCNIHV